VAGGLTERLSFLLELDTAGAIRSARQFGDTAEREMDRANSGFGRVGTGMQVAGAGMLAFAGVAGAALAGFARASEEANLSQVKLQNSIENSPELAGASIDAFNDLATAIQSKTAADGDQIVSAMAMLGTFHLTQQQIEATTPLVVDYARKFGVDLVTAATQVGKAMAGNVTTLQKNGIMIDANAFATDHFSAVTDALRENVGGFAEEEGATFSGRLESLKNQLGDVAEGIGGGVISAVENLIGPITTLAQKFAELDPGTQTAIGSIATYGTALIGAAGAASFTIGTVVKMRDNFSTATTALSGFVSKAGGIAPAFAAMAGPVGGVVVGLGLLTAAFYAHTQRVAEAERRQETFATAIRESGDAVEAFRQQVATGEIFDDLDQGQAEFIGHMRDLHIEMNDLVGAVTGTQGAFADFINELIQGTPEQYAAVYGEFGGTITELRDRFLAAADAAEFEDGVLNELGVVTDDTAGSTEHLADKVADLTHALKDAYDQLLSQTDLTAAWEGALDDLTASVAENGATLDLSTEAGRANYDQGRQVADGLVDLMQRRFDETGSLGAATDAGNLYVEQLKAQLRQAGLTEDQISDYIGTLHLVPTEIASNITANTRQAVEAIQELQRQIADVTANSYEVDFHARTTGARAKGGPVRAGMPYLVGEQGPELIVPGASGTVIPNDKLAGTRAVAEAADTSRVEALLEQLIEVSGRAMTASQLRQLMRAG
jgi:hypothetical protein